jgi:RNA polymerase sigma-70 factor, ECF subfamily
MRNIHDFRGEATFSTWLYRVVMSTVFMQLRRRRLPESSLCEVSDREGAVWPGRGRPVGVATSGDSSSRIDLDRAIAQLPAGFKAALLFHDVEGYGHGEIAGMMGWSTGTSKSELHRARQRVRELLRTRGPTQHTHRKAKKEVFLCCSESSSPLR